MQLELALMANPFETRDIDNLDEAAALPDNAQFAIQAPEGPALKIPAEKVIGRLVAVDVSVEGVANLPNPHDHEDKVQAYVYADPLPWKNGYYTKFGALGAGEWIFARALNNGPRAPFSSWADLLAEPGTVRGERASVSALDSGTHNDPVTSAVGVDNEGEYSWSTNPAGWERVGDYGSANIASDAEADAGLGDDKAISPPQRQRLELVERELNARAQVFQFMQRTSLTKPLKFQMAERHRGYVEMRPHDGSYRDGHQRGQMDRSIFEVMNLSEYHGLPTNNPIWIVISIVSEFDGVETEHCNLSFDRVINGSEFNNGQAPTLFDPVKFIGAPGDSLATINSPGSAPLHGRISYNGLGIYLNGGANLRDDLQVGQVYEGDTLSFQPSWNYLMPDGSVGALVTGLHLFAPLAGHQLKTNFVLQMSNAFDVDETFGYSAMIASRWANRVQSRLKDGSKTAVQTIGLGQGANIPLGTADRITMWKDSRPGHALDLDISPTYAPFRRDGVTDAYSEPAFGLDNSWGFKGYVPFFGASQTRDNVRGAQFSTLAFYNAVMADGA
jgi:hypothetical protein